MKEYSIILLLPYRYQYDYFVQIHDKNIPYCTIKSMITRKKSDYSRNKNSGDFDESFIKYI